MIGEKGFERIFDFVVQREMRPGARPKLERIRFATVLKARQQTSRAARFLQQDPKNRSFSNFFLLPEPKRRRRETEV